MAASCWRSWKVSCWIRFIPGRRWPDLIDGISQKRFKDEGPILFVHTGGAPALFAYHPHI
jgi:hypothetical protein